MKGQNSVDYMGHQEQNSFSWSMNGSRKGEEGEKPGGAEEMTTCAPGASSSAGSGAMSTQNHRLCQGLHRVGSTADGPFEKGLKTKLFLIAF